MHAAILRKIGSPLALEEIPLPEPSESELLIKIEACGLCRTDLHIIDGELPSPNLPLILGHEIVGRVVARGEKAAHRVNDRVGVPWLGKSCGSCSYCLSGRENLCDSPLFTGYSKQGGFAEYTVAESDFVFPLTDKVAAEKLAPLLCAGLIGWRALKMCGEAEKIGFYGFGASAHLLAQIATRQGRKIYAFTRPLDREGQAFALSMGALWAGGSDEAPPELLDAAILFAPVGELIPIALKAVKKGGAVIAAGIHMSDIPSFPYRLLWEERRIRSVANLTREDGREFFEIANTMELKSEVTAFALEQINEAISALREGRIHGAAVIINQKKS